MLRHVLKSVLMICVLSILSCASSAKKFVTPLSDGTNKLTFRGTTREGTIEHAIEGANDFCEDQKKFPVYSKNETKYVGQMDESTRETVQRASEMAVILGGMNTPTDTAGRVGMGMTSDKAYETELVFICK